MLGHFMCIKYKNKCIGIKPWFSKKSVLVKAFDYKPFLKSPEWAALSSSSSSSALLKLIDAWFNGVFVCERYKPSATAKLPHFSGKTSY